MSFGWIGSSLSEKRPEIPWRGEEVGRLTKVLVNVLVERSLGPVHLVMSSENTVEELVRAAVEVYLKEGRRPLLQVRDPKEFDLHYSQFSLERLDPQEKLINLGSRNFFLCSSSSKSKVLVGNC